MYNRNVKPPSVYHWVDVWGLFRNPNGPNYGMGDTIFRTMIAYLSYNDPKLVQAIERLWDLNPPIKGMLHPEMPANEVSRDHYIYSLVAFSMGMRRKHISPLVLKKFAGNVPFNIKSIARIPSSLVGWTRALSGRPSGAKQFYIIEGLMSRLVYVPMTKFAFWITGTGPEVEQDQWKLSYLQNQPRWKWWILKNIAFPAYAITFTGFQFHVVNDYPKLKAWAQRGFHPILGKTNYVQKILFNAPEIYTNEFYVKVNAYRPMTKMRWTGYLNQANDRSMVIMEPKKYNNLDVDILKYLLYLKDLVD